MTKPAIIPPPRHNLSHPDCRDALIKIAALPWIAARQFRNIDGEMTTSVATCINGRPLFSSSATASRLNSGANSRLVLVIQTPFSPIRAYQRCPPMRGTISTSSISSSLLKRSRSNRLIRQGHQRSPPVTTAWVITQYPLAAIERLDLAFLIDAQNQGARRWGHVEPDDVADLGHQVRVCRELEGLGTMRLQTEGPPDTLNRRGRQAARLGHAT